MILFPHFLTFQEQPGPTVPQWAATIILLAALVAAVVLFFFVLKAIKNSRKKP